MLGRYIQSYPIGLNGCLNTYGYVGGDSLNNIDYYGLSFKDVEVLYDSFHTEIEKMIADGIRSPGDGGDWFNENNALSIYCNPHNSTNNSDCCVTNSRNKREICSGQVTYLMGKLKDVVSKLDDCWEMVKMPGNEVGTAGHYWLVLVSSNPEDPYIWMDHLINQASIGRPCPGVELI